jgi:transitional endoplasmic reticulum ATPase
MPAGQAEPSAPTLTLRVSEADEVDIGHGIARLAEGDLRSLGLQSGEILQLGSRRATGAIALVGSTPGNPDPGTIRIESVIRRNAGVSAGDYISVRKATCPDATVVALAPLRPAPPPQSISESFVSKYLGVSRLARAAANWLDAAFAGIDPAGGGTLRGRPVATGDLVSMPAVVLSGEGLVFEVVATEPPGLVRATEHTRIETRARAAGEPVPARPTVSVEDIGGNKEVLAALREMVDLPLRHPELFERLGVTPPKGVLLYGPPGTGKTRLAQAVASEAGAYFISIAGPEILSGQVGESERILREKFKEARDHAPAIIFLDEVDSLVPRRDSGGGEVEKRIVAQMLTLMDGASGRGAVVVIGATNRADAIDPALRRPGRFDREIEVALPDAAGRKEILAIQTRNIPIQATPTEREELLRELADATEGYGAADLAALVREAAMHAIRRFVAAERFDMAKPLPVDPEVLKELRVTPGDLREALRLVVPSSRRSATSPV